VTDVAFTRCARPHLTARRISTYTILGFTGYVIANVVGVLLASHWELSLSERLVAFFVPPIAFIVVVTISSALAGHERIVFYQTTVAGAVAVALLGWLAGARIARLFDLVTLCIGVFLVFGRLGCHSVACCHGTLGRGVTYGPPHVAVGFWPRWSGRTLWPVQVIEAIASGMLVGAGIAWSAKPGRAALIYVVGYAAVRFVLELVRGDGKRPYVLGVSEAQWVAVATALLCAALRPGLITGALASALLLAAVGLVRLRHRRELLLPPHLFELDRMLTGMADGERHETSLGVAVSRHVLPDGRIDWILSSSHRSWSEVTARRLAHRLWASCELVPGQAAGVIHVLTRSAMLDS
jgi:hypothetical protein